MATALARRAPARVSAPSTTRIRTIRVAKALARRGGSAAARAALSEKHTIAAVGTAAAFGYMSRPGSTPLPHIAAMGQAGTYGLALWGVGKFTKSPTMQHMATGLLAVQAAEWARTGTVGSTPTTPTTPTTPPGGRSEGMAGIL